jgi:hypothetical protein
MEYRIIRCFAERGVRVSGTAIASLGAAMLFSLLPSKSVEVAAAQPGITRPPGGTQTRDAGFAFAQPEPDVITRGRATTITVRGRAVEELRTLRVDPPDGIRIGGIRALGPQPDGSQAISVTITVDAGAEPGDRALTLSTAPAVPGALDAKLALVGSLRINSHDVRIVRVDRGASARDLRISVTDESGDIAADGRRATVRSSDAAAVVPIAVVTEVRCGQEAVDSIPVDSATVESRTGSTLVIAARLTAAVDGRPADCHLRVRVQDNQGNVSAWAAVR